jgi:triacylglycerol lipase
MPPDVAEAVQRIGRRIDPPASAAIFAPRVIEKEPYEGIAVERDLRYGPAERNLIDVFAPTAGGRSRPVLLFVHGGAFVAGNRRLSPTSPFYENVALFAARNGMVGVNMTYRLAPKDPWPAGPEDIGYAVKWLHENIASRGGDPKRIFLFGHSAGASHSASYVARERFHRVPGSGIAGLLLLSGNYQVSEALVAGAPTYPAYYGNDPSKYAEMSSVEGLLATKVPLWISSAELDPPAFDEQARILRDALCASSRCPAGQRFPGHGHMSEAYSIHTDDRRVADSLRSFMDSIR